MSRHPWQRPALASLVFLLFSLGIAAREGLFGFIDVIPSSGWSLQIFLDLVLASNVALVSLAPAARRVGLRMRPWVVLTILTGSIGLLALAARIAYLEGRQR
ncbi:MAG: hypothetical protein R3B09_12795 [Nannocystaceae bacterium]